MWPGVELVYNYFRTYDPSTGRYLESDPIGLQGGLKKEIGVEPHFSNRYSYVLNNPMAMTDPSGFLSFKTFYKGLMKLDGRWATHRFVANHAPALGTGIQIGLSFIPYFGQLASAHFAFDQSFFATRSFSNAIRAGAISYASSQAFNSIGDYYGPVAERSLWGAKGLVSQGIAHGVVGGISAELGGGKFGHGFASAGIGFAAGAGARNQHVAVQGAASIIAGGTASAISGGKFSNGALTAAMGFVFNQMSHDRRVDELNMTKGEAEAVAEAATAYKKYLRSLSDEALKEAFPELASIPDTRLGKMHLDLYRDHLMKSLAKLQYQSLKTLLVDMGVSAIDSGVETVITGPASAASKVFSTAMHVKNYSVAAWDIFDFGNPDVMIGCSASKGCIAYIVGD